VVTAVVGVVVPVGDGSMQAPSAQPEEQHGIVRDGARRSEAVDVTDVPLRMLVA